jgi:cell division protein FtsI/penicillin-binding protein 2
MSPRMLEVNFQAVEEGGGDVEGEAEPRRFVKRATALVLAAVLLAAAGGALYFLKFRDTPEHAATEYLAAWQRSDYSAMAALVSSPPADLEEVHKKVFGNLGVNGRSFKLREVAGSGDRRAAAFTARLMLTGAGEWAYQGRLELIRQGGKWLVGWSPAAIHPDLPAGATLRLDRTWPERGKILAFDGQPITDERRVVVVGIEPRRIKDRAVLVKALVDNLQTDPAHLNALLDQPGLRPDWFLPVKELTVESYDAVKPAIYPVPGLVFQNKMRRQPPSEGFARHVLGTVGEVTKEGLDRLKDPYQRGDQVGLTGLEAVFERTLAGRPALEVAIVDAKGRRIKVLHRVAGKGSEPVQTTLSLQAQEAAEAALEGVTKPAAIVVVDVATSQVRAVASRPLDQFNRALTGRYPPGSSFKIVTAAALLRKGVSPSQTVGCPAEAKAGGKTFRNFESKALGAITFRQAFVQSCNTAFVGLASSLGNGELAAAAADFGFGKLYPFPLKVAGGSFPEPTDAAERAASAIGQGRVLASPLHMATVAAAAAGGGWHAPQLVAQAESPASSTLSPEVAGALQSLMSAVVTEGTGVKAQVPGKPVAGKTGTAEFGHETPPQTHAWFVGYSGQSAFAVLVEGGGVGGEVAAPIAARLVSGL